MFKEINTLKLFLNDPTREYNVREVARLLKMSPATASNKLKSFFKEGFLQMRKERILDLYKADIDSEKFRDLKIFYNIRNLKESGLIESLNEFYLKPVIVLFGSASFGMDIKDSDFDLLVVSEKISEFKGLKKFENKLKRNLQIFNVKKIKDLKNENLINNVVNGISLQGKLKWI